MDYRNTVSRHYQRSVSILFLLSIILCQVSCEVFPVNPEIEKNEQEVGVEKISDIEEQQGVPGGDVLKIQEPEVADDQVAAVAASVNLGFLHAFVASLSVIIVSELGDKTFFIAAIMAMRHKRFTVFGGAIGALALMTVLSALLGFATTIIPRTFTLYASTLLFIIFGLRMLKEGWNMSPDEGQEEYEEVQADLKRRDDEMEREQMSTVSQDAESGIIRGGHIKKRCLGLVSPILLQAFMLTFLAEWGDRSQIATIVLAAREDVLGVTIGGILGHSICTALAVIGGRIVAQKISVRTVTLLGGVVFLLFGLTSIFLS